MKKQAERGLLIGALTCVILAGLSGLRRGLPVRDEAARTTTPVVTAIRGSGQEPGGDVPTWFGVDPREVLGPFSAVSGHADSLPGEDPPLRIWVLIAADACPSCRDVLPGVADLIDSLDLPGVDGVAVVYGNHFEARRTFWGFTAGLPLVASARADIPARLGITRTPGVLISWHGRAVAAGEVRAGSEVGREWLGPVIGRLAAHWTR
jgi:hypothetical protein